VIAGTLFVIPGVLILLGLSALYATVGTVGPIAAVFAGIKPTVLAIVVDALRRVGGRALKHRVHWTLAGAAFIALAGFAVPFPIVVLAAGLIGWWIPAAPEVPMGAPIESPSWNQTFGVLATGLILWWGPIGLVAAALGSHRHHGRGGRGDRQLGGLVRDPCGLRHGAADRGWAAQSLGSGLVVGGSVWPGARGGRDGGHASVSGRDDDGVGCGGFGRPRAVASR
jgi:hypothetical protein